jgi:adenosine deaminase
VIDALSIRNFHPTAEDRDVRLHFFATFGKFDLITNKHWGEMLAEVTHRAGAQSEVYLETMLTPDQGEAIQLGKQVGWNDDFGAMRSQMLAGGMAKVVADGRKNLDDAEAKMRKVLGCDAAQPDVGCGVTLRYLNQVLRAFPKEQVFAQMVAGFEIASADPRVAGINLVQSQDEFNALNDFDLQMRMLDYLHGVYPRGAVRVAHSKIDRDGARGANWARSRRDLRAGSGWPCRVDGTEAHPGGGLPVQP